MVDLETDVIYPLLLELYSDYSDGVLSKADFIPIIYLIESYLVRRAVCGIPSNGLNKFFPSFTKKIDKKQYLKSVEEHFGSLTGNQKFPNDFEFKDSFITKELYGRNKTKKKKTKYFLERLEKFDTEEPVDLKNAL